MDKETLDEYARLINEALGTKQPAPIEEIAKLIEAGRDQELPAFSIYMYAASLARAGQVDRAEQVAALIKDDEEVRGQALAAVVDGMTKVGLLDRARAVLNSIPVNTGNEPWQCLYIEEWAGLAEASGKLGDTENARTILVEAEKLTRSTAPPDNSKADWLFTLANVWAGLADPKRAFELWSEAFQVTQNSLETTQAEGVYALEDHKLLMAIIRSMVKFGMSSEASVLAGQIKHPLWRDKAQKLLEGREISFPFSDKRPGRNSC